MPSNLLFNSENVVFDNYDNNSKTLTIKDVEDETYYLTFDNYVPETLTINVINSKVSIIENYKGNLNQCHFIINVDETASAQNKFALTLIAISLIVLLATTFVVSLLSKNIRLSE